MFNKMFLSQIVPVCILSLQIYYKFSCAKTIVNRQNLIILIIYGILNNVI